MKRLLGYNVEHNLGNAGIWIKFGNISNTNLCVRLSGLRATWFLSFFLFRLLFLVKSSFSPSSANLWSLIVLSGNVFLFSIAGCGKIPHHNHYYQTEKANKRQSYNACSMLNRRDEHRKIMMMEIIHYWRLMRLLMSSGSIV